MALLYPGPAKWNIPEPLIISGRFRPNGSSAIDNTLNKGPNGWTVARTSTGVYTITFTQKYYQCVNADAWFSSANPQNALVQPGIIDVASGKTFVVKCVQSSDGSTAVDLASDANTWIHFQAILAGTQGK